MYMHVHMYIYTHIHIHIYQSTHHHTKHQTPDSQSFLPFTGVFVCVCACLSTFLNLLYTHIPSLKRYAQILYHSFYPRACLCVCVCMHVSESSVYTSTTLETKRHILPPPKNGEIALETPRTPLLPCFW